MRQRKPGTTSRLSHVASCSLPTRLRRPSRATCKTILRGGQAWGARSLRDACATWTNTLHATEDEPSGEELYDTIDSTSDAGAMPRSAGATRTIGDGRAWHRRVARRSSFLILQMLLCENRRTRQACGKVGLSMVTFYDAEHGGDPLVGRIRCEHDNGNGP